MQYKGEDLDLRVPHGRSPRDAWPSDFDGGSQNGRWVRGHGLAVGSGEPLWVDEVLLACCNYAFDVAQANGAAEVGLEHLVNALTRVDTAARTLELRGVREGQLRRESAALIASEIPAVNASDAAAPRRSGELEDVLRRASDLAHRRGVAAGVDDVLWILLHYGRDLPVVLLLRRLTPDWQRSDWGRAREMPLAPEPAPRSAPVQLVPNDGLQARMSGIEDSLRILQAEMAADRKLMVDLIRDLQRDVVAQRGDGAAFRGDMTQRLESLERMSRSDGRLPVQLAERISQLEKTVQTGVVDALRSTRDLGQRVEPIGDRLLALERTVQVSTGESATSLVQVGQRLAAIEATLGEAAGAKAARAVMDRLTTLEKAVHGGLGEGARNWAHLGQRLAHLETAISEPTAVAAMADRLGVLEKAIQASLTETARHFGHIGERMGAVESAIGRDEPMLVGLEPLTTRLTAIEHRLDAAGTDLYEHRDLIGDRLQELGRLLIAGRSEADLVRQEVANRLSAIETYLADSPATPDAALRELSERLGGLERAVRSGFGEAATATGQIAERLIAVERRSAEHPAADGETMLILDERLGGIERQLETRGQQTLGATAEIMQRLVGLEQRPVPAATIDAAQLIGPVDQRLSTLETGSLARAEALTAGLTAVATRIEKLEQRIGADAAATEEALRGRDQDFDFIYGEIKQLGQSQATLNSAVSDWRTESKEHFSAIADRLDKLKVPADTATELPVPPAPTAAFEVPPGIKPAANSDAAPGEALNADAYALPEGPQRGFWHWLFGTTSIRRAHREGPIRMAEMREKLRQSRDQRRAQP